MSRKSAEERDSPENSSRRDRAAIAAQACQTCRSRKSKCDEQRPKCGLCTRLGVECVYREPQPTKKDKTLVHILSVLERVEAKVDRLNLPRPSDPKQPLTAATAFELAETELSLERIAADIRQQDRRPSQTYLPAEIVSQNTHLTAAHRVLLWPSVYLLLTNARITAVKDLHHLIQQGTPWFTHLELKKHPPSLPSYDVTHSPTNASHPSHSFSLGFAGLSVESIRQLVDAYFDNYNVLHPILDQTSFEAEYVLPIVRGGYEDRHGPTTLVMLVLALGRIATDGAAGPPVEHAVRSRSGIRGGTSTIPPGLDFFNAARRRLGFIMQECSLENVQIYLLQATYFEACARHMDYWRSCASASMAFQLFVRCETIDWSSQMADVIKRVYWSCILHEDLYHIELDLPRTGIYTLEDKIPLPSFQDAKNSFNDNAQNPAHYHYHFLAMIALRRLLARIHEALHSDNVSPAESNDPSDGVPVHLIKELARQLESWRTYLPQPLQWSDADAHSYPNVNPLSRSPPGPLFTPESLSPSDAMSPSGGSDTSGVATFRHRFNFDVVTGHLRTRFYYARYLIYRPFIFKALHFPEAMTADDAAYAALAIQSACVWPLAMAPCRDKKRLIPGLFTWTHNFVGILLLLRVADESESLRKICEDRVSRRDMNLTVGLLLDWVNDMRAVDGMAEWAWTVLEPLFSGYR